MPVLLLTHRGVPEDGQLRMLSLLLFLSTLVRGSPQNTDHADWRLCRLSTFFLILVFTFTLDSHIFGSGHKLVFSYISESLFMQRMHYVTLACYMTN